MEHVTEKGLLKPEVSLILQNVFTTCDEEKHGTVKVSKLITFMKEKATETEVFDYLNDLSLLLDGDGTDPSIDWSKCEKGMQKWIQVVNEKSISDVNSSPPAKKTLFLNNNNNNNKLSPNSSVINKSLILEASSLMSTYSNDSMETSELSWENSDLQIRIDELEITNKRLLEDMIKLKQHLDVTEDQNSSFLHENDDLQKQVLRYEKLLDESKLVAKNYEELKATVHEYHSFKNDLVEKTCELEKENTSLQIALKKCEDKVIQLDNNLETLKEEKENLNKDLISQKQLFQQIDDLTSSKDDISEEFVNKSEYMSSLIAELSLANEVLKAQKNTVENELSEIKQEMSRNSMLNRFPGIHSTPMLSSTKCDKWPQSLDQELKEGMENSVDLDGSHIQSFYDFSDGSDNSSLLKNLPHKDRYTMFAQQCRTKFEEKKEIIFDKIEEIVLNRKTSGNMENASMIFDDLNTDFELFTEKITELAQEKQDAEKRALKLASALRKLKDDNKFLQNSKDKALLKFGCLSISSMELEERKSELIQELSEKDRTVAKLKEEILQMQEGLVEKKKSSKKLISCTTESTQTSEITSENITEQQQQVQDLKKLVKSLESRNFEFSRKVFELEEREDVIDKLRQDLLFKDDALSTLKIKYEQELSAIFQIIPNNVSSLPTKVSAITSKDIADHLLHFLKRSKHEYNRLLGVRESPEGGPHLSDSTQTDYAESSINTKADFCKGSARTCLSFETVHCSVQTELNMLTMNKILEAYDLMPTAVEPIIPERLRRHNSIDLAVDETNKDEPQKPSPILEEEREENKERDVITCQVDTTPVCAEPNDKVLIASEMESGSTTKEEDELDHVGDRKCSSETVISSRYMDIPPVILTCDEAENEDSSCTDDNKELLDNAQICLHPKNLKIASIIEFDRSDISSDSEPEQSFRRRTNRRTRTSLSKRSKVNLEAEPPEPEQTAALDENNNNNILSKLKQRRIGVSAEPVRVSWSILRENFKQQQIENIEDTHAMEYNNGYTEELIQDIEAEIESIPTGCSPEVINTGKVVTSSVPIIEVEEEQNEKVSSHSDSNHDDAAQKQSEPSEKIIEKTIDPAETTIESRDEEPDSKDEKEDETTEKDLSVNSLKVPEIVYKKKGSLLRQSRAFIPESCADMGDEDMERRFSNIVLSFQTDQYTLQKRRDNQERARDVAEASMDKEIAKFSSKIKELHTLQNGTQEFEEACGFLKRQAEILRKAAMKISAQSEQHGCYQQENRTVPNMELMIAYTGILKLNLSRMTDELSECRRRLQYQSDRSDLSECETIKVTSDGDAAIVDSNDDGNADDGQASSDPEPVRKATLAGISRTLILAQGISTKVRRKRKDALNVPTFTKKRVSFSETMFTEDSIAREPIIECSSNPAGLALHQMKRIGIKLAIFLFILLVIYFIFFTINSLEIDTLRLHDKILQYIPHSIEYQTNSEGR